MNSLIDLIKLYSFSHPSKEDLIGFANQQAEGIDSACKKLEQANKNYFVNDSRQVLLGKGPEVLEQALQAVYDLQMFNLPPFCKAISNTSSIKLGTVIVVTARALGLWVKIASFVSEIIQSKDQEKTSVGFAYTTLAGHIEFGKEWFRVDYYPDSQEVYFNLSSISRPNYIWCFPIYPIIRFYQLKFQKLSLLAMKKSLNLE